MCRSSNPFPDARADTYRFAFDNPNYGWGDASILHAMIRRQRPRRFVEIGSGWSSACAADTVEHYLDGACSLTFIEPHPELLRELLGNSAERADILETRVQDVPLEIFEALESGDILFIDSTHIVRTGSDVCFELFEILPRLRPGVLVHFHDIFWPFEYPRVWAVDDNRSWNELYAVRAFLTDNPHWRIVLFSDYLAHFERAALGASYPRFLRNTGAALWLQRR